MASSKRKHLKPGGKVLLLLTEAEAGLTVELPFIVDDLIATIYSAKLRDGIVSAQFTLSDLEELGECIAAEANNTKDKKLRKQLDAISEKIEKLNMTYCDEASSNQAATQRHLVLVRR